MTRVLSGMRPTGELHLGNILGALQNWVALQEKYECYYMIADYHFLTTDYEKTQDLQDQIEAMTRDFLAAGLRPDIAVLFRQSDVPEHALLHLLLSMIVPLSWLERNPTYKEQLRELKTRQIHTYGFLGYPVLQAADILLYRAELVPVGEDQLAHLELCRELVRRFHALYQKEVFVEPQPKISLTPKILGLDGRKMSKSYQNAISLSDQGRALEEKIMSMFTDPEKIRKDDPGNPDGCVVYSFHAIYTKESKEIAADCRAGKIGCVHCKKNLYASMSRQLQPLWEKRREAEKEDVQAILKEGAKKAKRVAQATLEKVRGAMGL